MFREEIPMRFPLRLQTTGTPVVLRYTTRDGEASIEVRVEADPEARPFWLGRFMTRREPGMVRAGRNRWFKPSVAIADMEAAAALRYGRRHARWIVHERLRQDVRRLREYGRSWSLYRLTVAVVSPDGRPLGSETVRGLAEHEVPPTGGMALIEHLAGGLLAGIHA
jgi:hypothetical protein